MSGECLNFSTNDRVCKKKSWRKLGGNTHNACQKHYTHPRNVNKTVTVTGRCTRDQPNQSFEKRY